MFDTKLERDLELVRVCEQDTGDEAIALCEAIIAQTPEETGEFDLGALAGLLFATGNTDIAAQAAAMGVVREGPDSMAALVLKLMNAGAPGSVFIFAMRDVADEVREQARERGVA